MTQDIIVLSQFSLSLEGIDASQSTISSYRGMEKPIVIVVAGFSMDDTTLACALGRATTRAYIVVPIELLAGLVNVKSSFLRKGLEKVNLSRILNLDACDPAPKFIANKVQKFAGAIGRHEIFGERFFYASRWRLWVYEGGAQWANRGVQLWGWWLSLSTSLPISGIDPVRNELTDCYLQPCSECNTTTPHSWFLRKCLTCQASPLDEAKSASIVMQAERLNDIQSGAKGQSLIKVAALVGDFQFPSSNYAIRGMTEIPVLDLATTIVEFQMRRGAVVATKSQIEQWLREVLVASELDDSIKGLAGRTISSLCAKKILVKFGTGQYRLMDPQ